MILIADSGTTKCDWIGRKDQSTDILLETTTRGMNPAYLKDGILSQILEASDVLMQVSEEVSSIYFFGSGCGVPMYQEKIENVLRKVFPRAGTYYVRGDIHGAVYACTLDPGVVGIMGTGSNCCFYDGMDIEIRIPSLGYTLMDEGSGNMIGKELLRAYYYQKMPKYLALLFEEEYDPDVDKVKQKLYLEPGPSVFLASHAKFVFDHLHDAVMHDILYRVMQRFFDNILEVYKEELQKVPLHLVGSIAYYSKDIIEELCHEKGYQLGKIVRRPVWALVDRVHLLK